MARRTQVLAWFALLATVAVCGASPNVWTPIGPPGGRATNVVLDPSSPSTVYAVVDGVPYQTTDGGATWTFRGTGLPVPLPGSDVRTQQILVDAGNPSVLNAIASWTLFRSVDGGASWTPKPNPAGFQPFVPVLSFLMNDPVSPGLSYLVFGEGVAQTYQSTDAGDTWAPLGVPAGSVPFPAVEAFAIDPRSPSTFYADVSGSFFVSTDRAGSWTQRGSGLPTAAALGKLLVAPTMPTTLYLYVNGNGLFRSTDAATTWTQAGLGRTDVIPRALDPTDPLTLYATQNVDGSYDGPLFKTTDGGASWAPLDRHAPGVSDRGSIFDLTGDPAHPGRLWAATASGVLTSADGGAAWAITTAGQATAGGAVVASIAQAPGSSSVLYAIGPTLWRSMDGGASWSAHTPEPPVSPSTFESLSLAIDPSAPSTQYLGSSLRGVFKSSDGGDTWVAANAGLTDLHVRALAIDPMTPAVLYAATDGSLMRSTDGAGSWTLRNPLVTGSLLLDPETPTTIYAGFGAFKSTDAGLSFATPALVAPLLAPSPGYTPQLTALALTPLLPSTLYMGFSAQVITPPRNVFQVDALYKSTDGLDTGGAVQSFDSPALAVDPTDPATIYSGYAGRVARSRNGGSTFTVFDAGLPAIVGNPNAGAANDLEISAAGDAVYLATFSAGTYRIDLPACATDLDCDDADACTTDTCAAGRCEHTALGGIPCTPGTDECGVGTCMSGRCVVAAPTCDDGDPCTIDLCTAGGTCIHLDRCGGPPSTTTTTTSLATTTTTSTTLPALLTGRILSLRTRPGDATRNQLKVISGDAAIDLGRGDGSPDDPVLHGATLRIVSGSAAGGFDVTHVLAGHWSRLGNLGQNKGYKWTNPTGPITAALVRPGKLVRAAGRGASLGYSLDDDPNPVAVVLSLGSGRASCMLFGGTTKFVVNRSYLAKAAPAPSACP
jgi:photosystem II stability/assembly factor-like uncharacterized protein